MTNEQKHVTQNLCHFSFFSNSIESGHVEQTIDISVKQGFQMIYVLLHKNTGIF